MPVKFKVPTGVAASVIKPKLLFPLKLKIPLFTISLLLFKVVFTVIDFSALFVNTLPLARVNTFWLIVPEFVKLLFNVKVPEPLIVPTFEVLPFITKLALFVIVPELVKVLFTVKLPPVVFVKVLFDAVVNVFCSIVLALVTSSKIFVLPVPVILLANEPFDKFNTPRLSASVVICKSDAEIFAVPLFINAF